MADIKAENVRDTTDAPPLYQEYIQKELKWIKERMGNVNSIIDVGCGEGRITKFLLTFTKKYVGVDLDSKAIAKAKKLGLEKAQFEVLDITKLSETFEENSFEAGVCLWNTIGNIEEDQKALKEVQKIVSKKFFVSAIKRGNLERRKEYYKSYGASFTLDEKTETFHSDAWGVSKAYLEEDLRKMCELAGFKVVKYVDLGDLAYGLELKK